MSVIKEKGLDMNENLFLNTKISIKLYETVSKLPVIDFHNHLNVADMLSDKMYSDLSELWIVSDPYKHRTMRILGVDEFYITGEASNYDKFIKWMECLPMLIGHPLYTWSQLELKRIFDIDVPLNLKYAEFIWNRTQELLVLPEYSNNQILNKFSVMYSAPCCSIVENVDCFTHTKKLVPSLRGDDIVCPTPSFVQKLSEMTKKEINTLEQYLEAIKIRLSVFEKVGCRFTDHALDAGFRYVEDDGKNGQRFLDAVAGKKYDSDKLKSFLLCILAGEYASQNWTMQLHIGALRHTSDRLSQIAGPVGGYAAIGAPCDMQSLVTLLHDAENTSGGLPRTVLFPLNPADCAAMAVLSGSFSESGIAAKVQLGPAWWWCDHTIGIRNVLDVISSYGVLSTFIGMTTDSRSVLSFVRHEYFRRIFCGWIGEKVASGELPDDYNLLECVAKKICYENAYALIQNIK